jgi:3-methyladenine DNA glycosylase AlkD
MATQGFYLVGDEINTARHISLSQIEDLASLKKKLQAFFTLWASKVRLNLNDDRG